MTPEKTALLQQLDAMRDRLWAALDSVELTGEVYPGWNKRDFYAHIAGWEALVYQVFRDYVAGTPGTTYRFTTVDDLNRDFVATRQSQTAEGARLECEINRFAIRTLLQAIPAEDYGKIIRFPWGTNTIIEFIQGAIEHEQEHADDIILLTQGGSFTAAV
jgi:hypothetical protein